MHPLKLLVIGGYDVVQDDLIPYCLCVTWLNIMPSWDPSEPVCWFMFVGLLATEVGVA